MTTKNFPLGAVLSLTQDALAVEFPTVHELIEYLVGGPVMTHELPAVVPLLRPGVLEQFPRLANHTPTSRQAERGEEGMREWVANVAFATDLPLDVPVAPLDVDLSEARREAWARIADKAIVVKVADR